MREQGIENRERQHSKHRGFFYSLFAILCSLPRGRGFTLIETMVAISLLTIAIVAPMLLTVQSLASAYYSRDQVTAFYLAQEAIEQVHQVRDGRIIQIAQTLDASGIDIFGTIPINQNFTVDAHNGAMVVCTTNPCSVLQVSPDGQLYGYGSGWTNSNFTRTVFACYVQLAPDVCNDTKSDEMRVSVTVSWRTGSYNVRSFTISEDLYRWTKDGSAS